MALKNRLADASYWVYDRMRHKTAFDAAARFGTAQDFAGLQGHKYALLATSETTGRPCRRPSGCPTRRPPPRHAHRGAHRQGAPHPPRPAGVLPCDPRGPGVEAIARILNAHEGDLAEAALDRHYGCQRRIYEKVMADGRGMVYLDLTTATRTPDGASA